MDTKQLCEMLERSITTWTHAQLMMAFEYCDNMCYSIDEKSVAFAWWYHLREEIRQEITARGGRRP